MSKLSFRPRALDATKPMPIYWKEELSDLQDYSVLNRAVPQMPSGMEKEEESEHHLQRAISVQQVYGDTKVMVIPVPEAEVSLECYNNFYRKSFRMPKHYIHNQAQALNSILEQEQPDYDLDSEDERWLKDSKKRTGLEIAPLQFEEMFDRLEKSSGNQLVTLQEAKLLLKEDDDLIKAVHDYWLNKRTKKKGTLLFQVRQERRDGSSSNDSYVAFRRRTEKMQTRKNRKNDEASYEKMLKLRRDLSRAVTVLALVKRREKSKRELLHLTLEVFEKRFQMKDWDGKTLRSVKKEMAAQKARAQFFVPGYKRKRRKSEMMSGLHKPNSTSTVPSISKGEIKRDSSSLPKKTKKKHSRQIALFNKLASSSAVSGNHPQANLTKLTKLTTSSRQKQPTTTLASVRMSSSLNKSQSTSTPTYQEVVDTMTQYEFRSSSDDDVKEQPGSAAPSDSYDSFRRKPGCVYYSPQENNMVGDWPWMTDPKHRYNLTTLRVPEKCVGFARRRMGRGGRIHLDRALHPYDRDIQKLDLGSGHEHQPPNQHLRDILQEIKKNRWRHFQPSNSPAPKLLPKEEEYESDCDSIIHWNSPLYQNDFPDPTMHKETKITSHSTSRRNSRFSSPKHKRAVTSRSIELDKSSVAFAMSALVTVATNTTTVSPRNSIGVSRLTSSGRLASSKHPKSASLSTNSASHQHKCVTCGGIVPLSATLTNSRTRMTSSNDGGVQQRALTLSVTSHQPPRTTVLPSGANASAGAKSSSGGAGSQGAGVPALIKISSSGSVVGGTVIYPHQQQGARATTADDVSKGAEQNASSQVERKLVSAHRAQRGSVNLNVNFALPANVLIKSEAASGAGGGGVGVRATHSAPNSPRGPAVVHMLPSATDKKSSTASNAKTISLNLANLMTSATSLPVTSSSLNTGKITIGGNVLKKLGSSIYPIPGSAPTPKAPSAVVASTPTAPPGSEKGGAKKAQRSSGATDDGVNHTVQIDIGNSPQVVAPGQNAIERIAVTVPTNKNAKASSRPMEVT